MTKKKDGKGEVKGKISGASELKDDDKSKEVECTHCGDSGLCPNANSRFEKIKVVSENGVFAGHRPLCDCREATDSGDLCRCQVNVDKTLMMAFLGEPAKTDDKISKER